MNNKLYTALRSPEYLLLVFGFVCCFRVSATTPQFLDSLKQIVATSRNIDDKLNALYSLSYEYGLIDPEKGKDYGYKCLKLAQEVNRLDFQFNAYNGIATCYETQADFQNALFFHRKSRKIAQQMVKANWVAIADVNIATCYKQLGQYKTSLKRYLLAYRVLTKTKDYNPRMDIYLAEIYIKTGDYNQAEKHTRIAIKHCQARHEEYISYNAKVNLAKCLQHKNQIQAAEEMLKGALKGLRENTDQISLAFGLNALGELNLQKKNYAEARKYFEEELKIHQAIRNPNGIYLALMNLANSTANIGTASSQQIRGYILQAESRFKAISSNYDMLLDGYQKAAQSFELIGLSKEALHYYKLYFRLNEDLLSKETLQQVKAIQTDYQNAKREAALKTQELKLEEQDSSIRQQRLWLTLLIAVLLLVGTASYFFLANQRLKSRIQKEAAIKDTEEKERLRISKDIHDDLGSGLSKINFLSEFILRKPAEGLETKEKAEAIAETSKQLVMNMRDLIWAMNPENTTLESLVFRIREYASDYLEDFPADLSFDLPDEIPHYPISKENYRNLLMVVKESLNNIVKHSGATKIHIRASVIANNYVEITVNDNGSGIPPDGNRGNGLLNMRTRLEQIGGALQVETSQGRGTLITACLSLN